jgi:adenylate cyclase
MTTDPVERRLAAILVADLVGYSRLVAVDEVGTLRDVDRWRRDIGVMVADGQGRLVDFTGDCFLAEFASVHRAVDCALAIHRAMDADGADRAPERRLAFRMGLHVGDVIVTGGSIAGHGVNVAARLEPLAPAGGLCVSETTYQQLRDVPGLDFEDLGELDLKNIPRPMRVYRVRGGIGTPASVAPAAPRRPGIAIAILPFENVSGDPEQEYFADGMTEDPS